MRDIECATPPHVRRPGTSTQFYQAFPRVSTASDKRWGEKAWVRGYYNFIILAETNWPNGMRGRRFS